MSATAPEPSLEPPDPPAMHWSDWTAEAYVSVSARTSFEAHILIEELLRRLNAELDGTGAIIQLRNENREPEPA